MVCSPPASPAVAVLPGESASGVLGLEPCSAGMVRVGFSPLKSWETMFDYGIDLPKLTGFNDGRRPVVT